MTWSFSRLKSYESCPTQWYYKYLMALPENERFYASFGSFCHELIAGYYRGDYERDELLPEFLCGFSSMVHGERPSKEIERKYLDQGAFYFEHFDPFPYETVCIEQEADFTVNGVRFHGFIDYLGRDNDGHYILIDHKSSDLKPRSKRKTPTLSDKKLDDTMRQLYLYSLWVFETYGEYPKTLCLNCFRTGLFIQEEFDVQKLEDAKEWVRITLHRLFSDTEFLPTDEYHYCRWICPFNEECDLYQDEYVHRRI